MQVAGVREYRTLFLFLGFYGVKEAVADNNSQSKAMKLMEMTAYVLLNLTRLRLEVSLDCSELYK